MAPFWFLSCKRALWPRFDLTASPQMRFGPDRFCDGSVPEFLCVLTRIRAGGQIRTIFLVHKRRTSLVNKGFIIGLF